ncbi:TBC1 domain family member 5 [Hondaea fermentalgiana]|uniref:TBC1 domain family member 5 n=1 Tax=Hondaea fermentalgiana TaxID=2315210 RepID=A0A2R5GTG8_9STRA|nr:TBC1 domain family member 5 [Hondaea fermentalgiana]|eukprot:GBG33619.1 TBC1 domain family member 5 [Hondaea fermentalgiana]
MAHAQAREVAARLKVAKGDDACAWEALADDMVAGNLASLQGLGARSLAWRAACGTLPVAASPRAIAATWPNVAADLRREYEALRESLVVDPDEAADDGDFDPLGGDPLGAAATGAKAHGSSGAKTGVSNPWEEFHKDKELLEEIRQDLERLYPTGCDDFFMEPTVSKVLQGVLFTWSKLHPDTSYRQGMHELAAPLLYCLHADATAANRARTSQPPALDEAAVLIGEALKHVFDATYLEHDLFWLFERVMRDMKPMFAVTSSARSQDDIRKAREAMKQASKRNRALGSGMGQESRASSYLEGNSDDATPPTLPPILLVAEEIQNVILSKVDGALQQHLSKLTIEPQVYALRWIRLLFGREFPIDQVMVLWDAMFAEAFTLRQRIASSQGDEVQAASIAKGARSAATLTVHDFRLDPDSGGLGLPRIACYFAVALLTYVRKDLLEGGYNEALMMLMKYPEATGIAKYYEQRSKCHKGYVWFARSISALCAIGGSFTNKIFFIVVGFSVHTLRRIARHAITKDKNRGIAIDITTPCAPEEIVTSWLVFSGNRRNAREYARAGKGGKCSSYGDACGEPRGRAERSWKATWRNH